MANMNLIGVFVTKLWPVQALACGGGGGGATKNIKQNKNIIIPARGGKHCASILGLGMIDCGYAWEHKPEMFMVGHFLIHFTDSGLYTV